jgi:hypothetical protein
MYRLIFIYASTILSLFCHGQTINSTDSTNIRNIYSKQFSGLLQARGVGRNEIDTILKKYAANNIRSDSDFAMVLKKFYNQQDKVGIIVYFLKTGNLRRVLFTTKKFGLHPLKLYEKQCLKPAINILNLL